MLVFSDNYGLTDFGSAALAGATTLASPAFAFAMLCDLINLSIDLYYAAKEAEFEGWLEERLLEARHLEKRFEEEKDAEKKAEILEKKLELERNIVARCRVYHEYGYDGCKNTTKDSRVVAIKNIFEHAKFNLKVELFKKPTADDEKINAEIQGKLDEKLDECLTNWSFKFLSFAGMTLLAVSSFVACPPLVIIGTVLVTAVSIYYALKHFRKLVEPEKNQVSVVKSSMFSPQPLAEKGRAFTSEQSKLQPV